MAFTKLKLTTFGQTIESKRHQGKGIHFTRVAIGRWPAGQRLHDQPHGACQRAALYADRRYPDHG